MKKGVLINFAKFSCEFCKIPKNTFFTEHLWATASKTKQKNQTLKTKDTETRKSKTQKDENLVLPKKIGRKCRLT